jgi:hypothetical protein
MINMFAKTMQSWQMPAKKENIENMRITSRIVLLSAALIGAVFPACLQATPYASSVTNDGSGNMSFYINENGGNAVVTFEDGSTNASFNGINTGTNLPSGQYTFSLGSHTTYAITVTKTGTGTPAMEQNVIQNTNTSVFSTNHVLFGCGDPRGVAVNVNAASPYFGRIYVSRGGTATTQTRLYDLNGDGSLSTAGTAGSTVGVSTWSIADGFAASPNRISIAPNDDIVIGDWSTANAGVWLADPNLTTNEMLLGPAGTSIGQSYGYHGSEVGRPVLLGDLNTGATLITVDADLYNAQSGPYNNILVYSNITWSALSSGQGLQAPPSFIGPVVTVNLPETLGTYYYFFPSLCVGPNGYIYSGEYRGGVSAGDPAAVQVYDSSYTNQLWNSRYNSGTSDWFYNQASGGPAKCNPTDLAVSPDGKYLVTVGIDNHFTVCALTNGIPDVATLYTIKPDRVANVTNINNQGLALVSEVTWDAGDNIYVLCGQNYGLKCWTLGQSTAATTFGTASGNTAFNLTFLNPLVSVYATNPPAISQANTYSHPTNGFFTIVRSGGNLSLPLTVSISYSGTATNGTYTTGSASGVTFAANQTTTNIPIKAVTDNIPRLTTYLTLTVAPSGSYTLQPGSATMSILNTATPYLIPAVAAGSMYNAFSNDYASLTITRLGDTNTVLTVNNFATTGSATNGTDYTAPTPVTFNPGDLTKTVYIYPLIAGHSPVHSPNLPFTGNKTAVIGLGAGSGYNPANSTARLTIVDSASPPAPVLYSDPLNDPAGNDAGNWNIVGANGEFGVWPLDTTVQFGCDLTTTPYYGIPFPPNGSQYALRMTVNKSYGMGIGGGPMTAVNAYLTNRTFSGNFAIRFNMNVIETGNFTENNNFSGTRTGIFNNEEGALFGFNHDGNETNWYAADKFTGTATNWPADGIFFWVSDSGGTYLDSFSPYEAFAGNGSPATNQGWALIGSQSSANFTTAFKTNVFTSPISTFVPPHDSGWTEGGPGLAANGSANYGLSVATWSDVEIKQLNGVVTMSIDKTPIFVYTNTTIFNSGLLMLGYEDPYNGAEDSDAAVYYSNLRVVSIGTPAVTAFGLNNANGTVVMNFSVTDDGSSLTVQSASNVKGPYTTAAATITPLGNGSFQAVVPQNGAIQFYRILQQ